MQNLTQETPDSAFSTDHGRAAGGIERHSIDWVPLNERHGKMSSVGAIWFVAQINLTGLATGVVALSVGASLFWTVLATVLGALFGTVFMALHSAQGPHLGLPQLVQSRPQFGYLGASLTVCVFALALYVTYNSLDTLLAGPALNTLFGLDNALGYVIVISVATVIALFGYNLIHRLNRWLTWPFGTLMAVLAVAAVTNGALPPQVWQPGPLQLAPFMTVFVIMAGWQVGWAPYVSDYSRYLRADVKTSSTFWWTFLPSVISGVWVFAIGAVVAAGAPGADTVVALRMAADNLFGGFGWIAILLLFAGLLPIMAANTYGASLTIISILDSFRPITPTRTIRVITIVAMFVVVVLITQFVAPDQFNSFYANVLIFGSYIFTPWTAINLVDYYLVRRGHYVISEIFNPRGIYGRWGWRGNLAYLLGIGAMVPFMVTAPFIGAAAVTFGGVDYSLFVGLIVSALVYWIASRSLDLGHERELGRAEGIVEGSVKPRLT